MNQISRRSFLATSAFAAGIPAIAAEKPKRVLLRSSWQTVNIGDIAHTPGVLSILRDHLPDVEVTLWPSNVNNGVEELLLSEFPNLKIAKGGSDLSNAFKECEFLLHGSGASLVAERDVVKWHEKTGKPYGIYGITLPIQQSHKTTATSDEDMEKTIEVLSGARFVYFRDSHSLALAKEKGCTAPVMEFGPDGAFACDLRDAEKAEAFLEENGLEEGKFLCCIPRLRYTCGKTSASATGSSISTGKKTPEGSPTPSSKWRSILTKRKRKRPRRRSSSKSASGRQWNSWRRISLPDAMG